MRILIYAHLFPPSKGGIQYSNLEIIKGLRLLGHDIRVIACHNKGIKKFVLDFPFPVKILPKWQFTNMYSLNRRGLLNWIFLPLYCYLIIGEIKNFQPEVALITDETGNAFWGAISRFHHIPYVSYWSVPVSTPGKSNDTDRVVGKIYKSILNLLLKWLWRSYTGAKSILVVSNSTKEQLIREKPEISAKIIIVPRSIDDLIFQKPVDRNEIKKIQKDLGIERENFVLLSVTRLTRKKGIDDVIRALAILDGDELRNIKYVVVGSGRDERYLKELAHSLNLGSKVIFTGTMEHVELISYYDMCDMFILPSRRGISESFGRVFVEAASRCKPSIGVDEGGMSDIIEDGLTGFLTRSGDTRDIKNIIKYSINNKERILSMGIEAEKKAKMNYTCLAIANKFDKYLRMAVGKTVN
jgi:glycosyltransferase involved in cell wall biosynthesis